MSMEKGLRSVVRSSELEMGLSSSDKLAEIEIDTAFSKPSSFKPFSSKPPPPKTIGPSMLSTNYVVYMRIHSLDLGIGFNL